MIPPPIEYLHFSFQAQLVPQDPIVILISTNSAVLQRIASPTSSLLDLIQNTIKQPMTVTSAGCWPSGDEELLSLGRSCLSTGWDLGSEIIREASSIPPDNFELILFSRVNAALGDSSASTFSATTVIPCATLLEGSSDAHVLVVCQRTGQQCKVLLADSTSDQLVIDSDDLLRKVKCAFGWQRSVSLQLQASDSTRLDRVSSQRLLSLSGRTFYAVSCTT
ncbi:unnamed protein product [Dicrocoelium dendriticum]|nr:unnamed protein product [Dicrocoelium dendriticum]